MMSVATKARKEERAVSEVVTTRLEPYLAKAFRILADKEQRTRSQLARIAIKKLVDDYSRGNGS